MGAREVEARGREETCNLSALTMSFSGSEEELAMAETLRTTTSSSSSSSPLPPAPKTEGLYCCSLRGATGGRAGELSCRWLTARGRRGIRFLSEIRAASSSSRCPSPFFFFFEGPILVAFFFF